MKFVRAAIGAMLMALVASSASAQSTRTVTATWDRNTDTSTTGYVLLYGTSSGAYTSSYDAGNQVSAQITLSTGSLYYFAVRAYDASGQQSLSSDEATIDLRTQTPAPTATISATLQNATTALVTWSTANATSATINGTAVGLSGSQAVPVTQTTTFTIVARNAAGATATQSATVTVSPTPTPAPTAQITATMQNANTALVSWSTTNATTVTINGLAVPVSGSQSVTLTATTTFTLVATGAGGTVTRSATATVSPGPTPAPTASLTATMQGTTNALVTWTTTNAIRAEINGIAVGLSGSTSVAVSGPTTFRLLATAASGAMVDSVASVAPPSSSVPNAPTNLLVTVSGSRATMSWRAPASGAAPQRYLLYVGTTPGSSNLANGYAVSGLSMAADLPRGSYYIRVKAANAAGASADSNEATFKIGKVLKKPSSFGVRWVGSVATLSWTVTAGDGTVEDQPTGYVLEAGTAPGLSNVAAVNIGNVTSFSAAIPAGSYYVRVRAVNDFGESEPTEEIQLAAPGAPGAPTNLVAFNSSTLVELRWAAPAAGAAPTTYVLEVGSAPGQSDLVTAAIGNVTRFTAPAPPAGTYYVRVRAVNGSGPGPVSNEVVVRR